MKPVIDPRQSELTVAQGGYFTFKPFATGMPDAWEGRGLPRGFEVDYLEGRVFGSSLEPGIYIFGLRAHNAWGWSAFELFTMAITDAGIVSLVPAIDIDIDYATRAAVLRGGVATQAGVLLAFRDGDVVLIRVRITKGGVALDLPLDTLKFTADEFEPEEAVLAASTFRKVGSGTDTAYELVVDLSAAKLSQALANYEQDDVTEFDGQGEFEAKWLHPFGESPITQRITTLPFNVRFIRQLTKNEP